MIDLYNGDCLNVVEALHDNCIDTIITDPPYGIDFMGHKWDNGVPSKFVWGNFLRIAKPGAILLSFASTRMSHRLTCAIEDAGWIIKDTLIWLYSNGFPKSLDISLSMRKNNMETSEKWNGYGTSLKPAYEPIIVAMKPLDGTYVENAQRWGVAGLNIAECRIGNEEMKTDGRRFGRGNTYLKDVNNAETYKREGTREGRFPANVLHDGSDEVEDMFEKYGKTIAKEGTISRFFYSPKASQKERNLGLEEKNPHPTVKPIALMEYLCNLTRTPTGGIVLDPFMGSGTTGIACVKSNRPFIGIELNKEYYDIAKKRIESYSNLQKENQ